MSVENPIQSFHGEAKSKQRFARADIEGSESVVLQEPNTEIEMQGSRIRRAIRSALGLTIARDRIDFWNRRYSKRGRDLIDIAENHEGFRGIGNVGEGREDAVLIPTRKNTVYDLELIEESLGDKYKDHFIEEVQVTVDSSTGITAESMRKTMSRKLSRIGIRRHDQPRIVSIETIIRPRNSSEFFSALERGDIKLKDGAVTYDIELEPKVQPQKREKLPKIKK